MKAARATSSFLSSIPANVSESRGHTSKEGERVRGREGERKTRGGTGRLNLPGEFMTELFKGCLVVLNP